MGRLCRASELIHEYWRSACFSQSVVHGNLLTSAAALALTGAAALLIPLHTASSPPDFPEPNDEPSLSFADPTAWHEFRTMALRRAKVWNETDPRRAKLGTKPDDPSGLLTQPLVPCQFNPKPATGTTPKFRCVLANGEVVKVKYGMTTGEVHAEVAAARLLQALGFGADDMFIVPKVRCYDCPRFPFRAVWVLDHVGAHAVAENFPDDRFTDFTWVSVERLRPGVEIANGDEEGWRWDELALIDPESGASRAEVDAFRLAARFLAHWDNKAANQRLSCESPTVAPRRCGVFAFIQDLGATFGPNKIDLDGWQNTPIWLDPATCTVSMRDMPYGGGTFSDVQVSEGGRALFLRQLRRLSDDQVGDLFTGARFAEFGGSGQDGNIAAWRTVFRKKVREVAEAGPCPATPPPPTS